MNRIYKVIWSKARNCYVVVSEIAKTHSKGGTGVSGVVKKVGSSALLTAAVTAMLMTPLGTAFADAIPTQNYDPTNKQLEIGSDVDAGGNNSVAIGIDSKTTQSGTVSIGNQVSATGKGSVAIGSGNTEASGSGSVAIGQNVTATDGGTVAIGQNADASADGAVAVGQDAVASDEEGSAFGHEAKATGRESTAIGTGAKALEDGDASLGEEAVADGGSAVAAGNSAHAVNANASAYGAGSLASGEDSTALGTASEASADDALAAGSGAKATAEKAVAVGGGGEEDAAFATAEDAIAIGSGSRSTAESAVAIGGGGDKQGAVADGEDSVALGTGTHASGKQSVAIGGGDETEGATALGETSIVMGNHATSSEDATNGIAIGTSSSVNAEGGAAFGTGSSVAEGATNGTALGPNSSVTIANGAAIGAGSVASTDKEIDGFRPNPKSWMDYTTPTWLSTEAAISIGDPANGITRQITGVAAGTEDTDAANVAQLKAAMTHYYSVNTTKETDEEGENNYLNDGATANNALAAGVHAVAEGEASTAMGYYAKAHGAQSIAIGNAAAGATGPAVTANGVGSTAIGSQGVTANGDASTALGSRTVTANGSASTAIGSQTVSANGTNSTAIGNSSVYANGYASTAIGSQSVTATGNASTAIGSNTVVAYGDTSTAIGHNTVNANGSQSSAFGANGINANGQYSTAIGNSTVNANGTYSTAVGNSTVNANGEASTALGSRGVTANGSASTAIGSQTVTATGSASTAIGSNTVIAYGDTSTAIGHNTVNANGTSSTALGSNGINANGQYSTAIGNSTVTANGYESTAIGAGSVYANGSQSTALGSGNVTANGSYSTAIGYGGVTADGAYSTAVGNSGTYAGAYQSTALGYDSDVDSSSSGSMAAGHSSKVEYSSSGSTAVGVKATVSNSSGSTAVGNDVHLSSGSSGSAVFGTQTSVSSSSGSTALGNNSSISNSSGALLLGARSASISSSNGAVAIGNNVKISNGSGSTVIGQDSTLSSDGGSMLLGNSSSISSGSGSHLLGNNSTISGGNGGVLLGNDSKLYSNGQILGNQSTLESGGSGGGIFGNSSTVSASAGRVIGNSSKVVGGSYGSMVVGNQSTIDGGSSGSFLIGEYSNINNGSGGSYLIGDNATITNGSSGSQAFGGGSYVSGSGGATALGNQTRITSSGGSQAIGANASVEYGGGDAAIGNGAKVASSGGATALGNGASVTGSGGSQALGQNSVVTGSGGATAVGTNATVAGSDNGLAMGARAVATGGWAATAIGTDATASISQGVALGSNALADIESGKTGYNPLWKSQPLTPEEIDSSTWTSTAAAVSVGGKTFTYAKTDADGNYIDADGNIVETAAEAEQITKTYTRQIANVAAGTEDTDAVNVAQLKKVVAEAAGSGDHYFGADDATDAVPADKTGLASTVTDNKITRIHNQQINIIGDSEYTTTTVAGRIYDGVTYTEKEGQWVDAEGNVLPEDVEFIETDVTRAELVKAGNILTSVTEDKYGIKSIQIKLNEDAMPHYYSVNADPKVQDNYYNEGATGLNALAAGTNAKAFGDYSVAIGDGATAGSVEGEGEEAVRKGEGTVALGAGAVANREKGDTGVNPLNAELEEGALETPTWTSTDGAVSVGVGAYQPKRNAAGKYVDADDNEVETEEEAAKVYVSTKTRQITNVAAGKEDTDAVNVAQLKVASTHYYSVNTETGDAPEGVDSNFDNQGATGKGAMAAGFYTSAAGQNSVATGYNSNSGSKNSVAIGYTADAYGEGAIALGHETTSGALVTITQTGTGTDTMYESHITRAKIEEGDNAGNYIFRKLKEKGADGYDVVAYNTTDQTYHAVEADSAVTGGYKILDKIENFNTDNLNMGGVSMGSYAHAEGQRSLAVGRASGAYGEDSSAIGIYANAVGDGAMAIGHGSSSGVVASVHESGSEGTAERADGFWTTEVQTDGTGNPVANGAIGGIAIGSYAHTEGTRALAVGRVASAYGENSTAIGLRSSAYGEGSMAFGHGVVAGDVKDPNAKQVVELHNDPGMTYDLDGADGAIYHDADGNEVSIDHSNVIGAVAIGSYAEATGRGALSVGRYSKAASAYSTTLGIRAEVNDKAENAIAIGREAKVEALDDSRTYAGMNSIAIGTMTDVKGQNSIAIGMADMLDENGEIVAMSDRKATTVTGDKSIAIGLNDTVEGTSSIAIGTGHKIKGDKSGAFGDPTEITGTGSYAMGNDNKIDADDGFILGNEAKVEIDGGVAIGSKSVASKDDGPSNGGYDVITGVTNFTDNTPTWSSTSAAVSVGGTLEDGTIVTRQIRNVAAGSADTDAVNVAQLKRVERAVSIHDYSVKSPGPDTDDNYNNTGAKDPNALAAGVNARAIGENATAVGNLAQTLAANATAVGNRAEARGDNAVALGHNAIAIEPDSVALGSNAVTAPAVGTESIEVAGTTYNFAGTEPVGTVSVGNAGAERTITNVAAGRISETSTDAINGSQLYAMAKAIDEVDSRHTTVSVGGVPTTEDNTPVEGGNLTLERSKNENGAYNYDVKLARDLDVDTIVVNGKDGAPGEPGLTIKGQDGAPGAIGIDGADGETKIITLSGKDGKDGTPGVDGESITRLIVDEHEVATLDDGMKYSGDFGKKKDDPVAVKLNKIVDIRGNAENEADLTDKNIGVVAEADGEDAKLTIKLNKDIDLGDTGSVTMGDTVINNEGMTITNGGPEGDIVINGDNVSFGGNVIHNVAPGVEDNDVVNVSQLKQFAAASKTEVSVGDVRVTEDGTPVTGGNLELKRTKDADDEHEIYDVRLSDNVELGGPGKDGKDGKDGSIGVNGADGKSGVGIDGKDGITVYGKDGKDGEPAVAINGKDGVGHIGLTGPAGKDGKDAKADITVQEGPVGVDGTDGADGKDGMDRIVYEDHNHVTHEVATLDDGMKYSGDFSHTKDDPVPVKLNNIVDIVGKSTAASADELSEGNIGVVAEQDGEGAQLVIKLNKNIDLTPDGSLTIGNTVINNEGMTITNGGPEGDIVINSGDVSFGGNVIHNVAPGVEDTDVVNVSQLKEYASGARTEVTVNEGTAAPTDGTYTNDGGNLQLRLTQAADGHDIYDVKLSDDINIGGPGKDGKDGVDGHIGVDGKDGKSGVGIDGKDGITVYGKDGKDGEPAVAINGKDGVGHIGLAGPAGKDGKDGVSDIHMIWGEPIVGKDGAPGTDGITRIEYTDPEGNPHQVATTDDGLYFGANTGDPNPAPNRINSRVNIMGAGTKDDDSYSGENLKTIISQEGEGKDAVTTINVVMDRDLNVDNIAVNGKDGKDGAPGTAGHIGVDGKDGQAGVGIDGKDGITVTGKDGKDGVTIYGKDGENGTEGHIGLTGQPGKDGKDAKADITVKEGPVGVDGTDGADGKDGMDRIVYEDHNGTEHEVATLDDGMKYSGDFGNTKDDPVPVKLNNNVDIVGNSTAASEDELSDGNIGVVAKPTEDGGAQLVVKLNKNIDLTEEGSVTMGDTVINNEGLTINNGGPEGDIVINKGDVSFGGNVIHNVAPGVEDTDVVNVSQLKEVEQLASQHSTVTVDGSPIDENVTDGNLLLTVTKEEGKGTNYDLKLNDNIELGGPGKDGKDGVDGSIGVNGADGKSGVGIDGKDGISVRGTDGKDGVTIYAKNGEDGKDGSEGHIGLAGKNGKDGADGVTDIYTKWGDGTPGTYGKDGKDGTDGITRIVYTDPEGDEHQVATMDDGLKFGANSGDPNPAVNKLSSTVEIKGAGEKDDDNYTGKNLKTIISQEGEGKDVVTTINVVMDRDLETDTLVVNGKDGKDGAPGTPGRIGIDGKDGEAGIGIDGKDGITITGKDGKDGVSIRGVDGKDGTEGRIGLAGRDGKDAEILIGKGYDGERGEKGANGVDGLGGEDGITRIIYQDPDGTEHQVATMDDGMKYTGDFGDGAAVKLNNIVNVVGEAKNEADLTTGNIGVVAAQDGDNGKLTVKLNKDIDLGSKGSVKMGDTTINNDGLTIKNGPKVTKKGIDAGGKKITNVAPGVADTDGVNVSQLKDFQSDVNRNIGDVNNRINRLGDRVDKVGAGAAALAGLHPLDFDPDAKWDVAAGYGHYRGENAVAVGAFYRPSEDVMVNVASTVGNGDNMISAGVSVKVGGNTHVSNSRVALSKQVLEMRKEIEDLRSLMADSAFGKQLDLSKLQLFPDTPENHWAYDYVATLAGNGLLEGYPDGNFRGNRALTRYEVAAILYRAMLNGAQLTQRALEEFAPELDRIRVDTLTRHSDGTPSIQRVRIIKDRR